MHRWLAVRSLFLKSALFALFFPLLFSLLFLRPVAAEEPAVPPPAPPKGCSKLVVSGHFQYPPFNWQEGDQIVGAGIELARRIGAELNLPVESPFVGPWARATAQLRFGKIDTLVAIYHTPERTQHYNYTAPYADDPVVIFTLKHRAFPFVQWDDLIPRTGVTTHGDSWGADFDRFIEEKLEVYRVARFEFLIEMLESQRADYAVQGLYTILANSAEQGSLDRIEILPHPVHSEPMWMAFSKKSPCRALVPYFARRLQELRADGTIKSLLEHYQRQWLAGS